MKIVAISTSNGVKYVNPDAFSGAYTEETLTDYYSITLVFGSFLVSDDLDFSGVDPDAFLSYLIDRILYGDGCIDLQKILDFFKEQMTNK